jgi:hypothetical protein
VARPGLTRHRKFLRLSRAIGGPIIARGSLELLWDSCYECGDDYVGTASDVELLIGWTGEPGVLARAMVEAGAPEGQGFIEPVPGDGPSTRYRVHDLWHHAPDYVAKRHKRELERNQKVKPSIDRRTAPNGGHCSPSPDCLNEVDHTPAPAPAPALAPAPAQKTVSPEPPDGDSEPAADPPVAFFQIVGKGGPEWPLRQSQFDSWQTLYPNLDLDAEIRKAVAWVAANPGRKKTAKGMPAFLVNWLNRSTDSPRSGSSGRQREYTDIEIKRYNDWLRALHGCGHNPRCEDRAECMAKFIGRLRGAA